MIKKKGKIEISQQQQDQLKRIGNKVRELREKTGQSYEVFAIKNDINRISQYRIEKGENFQMNTLLKIIQGLEMTPEEFFKDFE